MRYSFARAVITDQGLLLLSKADVVAEGKQYIDDVSTAKKLEVPLSGDAREIRFQGWDGLGISEQNTDEYRVLFEHLMSAVQRSVEDNYPQRQKTFYQR
jgi:hypothetical protein